MNTWFTVKVKYLKQLEDGTIKRVTEPYLVDATSFMEAEARMNKEIGELSLNGDFVITGISKTQFEDIFYYEDSGDWYKCKLTYVTLDADEGKEKKITANYMVTAHNTKDAYERMEESLSDMIMDFEIPAISLTNIADVFPYEPTLDVDTPSPIGNVLRDFDINEEDDSDLEDDFDSDEVEIDEHVEDEDDDLADSSPDEVTFEDENEE